MAMIGQGTVGDMFGDRSASTDGANLSKTVTMLNQYLKDRTDSPSRRKHKEYVSVGGKPDNVKLLTVLSKSQKIESTSKDLLTKLVKNTTAAVHLATAALKSLETSRKMMGSSARQPQTVDGKLSDLRGSTYKNVDPSANKTNNGSMKTLIQSITKGDEVEQAQLALLSKWREEDRVFQTRLLLALGHGGKGKAGGAGLTGGSVLKGLLGFEALKSFGGKAGKFVGAKLKSITTWVGGLFGKGGVIDDAAKATDTIGDVIGKAKPGAGIGAKLTKIGKFLPKLLGKAGPYAMALMGIIDGLDGLFNADKILDKDKSLVTIGDRVAAALGQAVNGLFLGIPDWIIKKFGGDSVAKWFDSFSWDGAKKSMLTALSITANVLTLGLANMVTKAFGFDNVATMLDTISAANIGKWANQLAGMAADVADAFGKWVNNLVLKYVPEPIRKFLGKAYTAAAEVTKNVAEKVTSGASAVGGGVVDFMKETWKENTVNTGQSRTEGTSPSAGKPAGGLGSVSAKYESGGAGASAIGYDKKGGFSYGTHQIASNTGAMGNFLKSLDKSNPEAAARLRAAGGEEAATQGTEQFKTAWKELSKDKSFIAAQKGYIGEQNYNPAVNKLNKIGLDVNSRSQGLQEAIYSTSVQHGGDEAASIVKKALAANKLDAKTAKDEDIIKALYAERGKRDENGNLSYFKSSTKGVQDSVAKRFEQEQKEIASLINPPSTTAPTVQMAQNTAPKTPDFMPKSEPGPANDNTRRSTWSRTTSVDPIGQRFAKRTYSPTPTVGGKVNRSGALEVAITNWPTTSNGMASARMEDAPRTNIKSRSEIEDARSRKQMAELQSRQENKSKTISRPGTKQSMGGAPHMGMIPVVHDDMGLMIINSFIM